MEMEKYSTLSRSLKLEPHHQRQCSIIPGTPFFRVGGSYLFEEGAINLILKLNFEIFEVFSSLIHPFLSLSPFPFLIALIIFDRFLLALFPFQFYGMACLFAGIKYQKFPLILNHKGLIAKILHPRIIKAIALKKNKAKQGKNKTG